MSLITLSPEPKNEQSNTKTIFEFYLKGNLIVNGSVKQCYFEFMLNDVSKTKQLEEKIIMDKTLLLGKISHEFKNNEIFKASDTMVDSLTQLIARKRAKNNN